MRKSIYWDDFERRIDETVHSIKNDIKPIVRRVAVFITNKCNFNCEYCNNKNQNKTLSQDTFINILKKYGDSAIIHITGGEPSTVKWLYPFIDEFGSQFRIHLNTNAYITPPYHKIRRLKISLDSHDKNYWNSLVGKNDAFEKVVNNIKTASKYTVTSLTYTLTKENYKDSVDFAKFAKKEFKNLYAIFFSVYKGNNQKFIMDDNDAELFFNNILPKLKNELNRESILLINETINEKLKLIKGIRFPQNKNTDRCYISMTERVISPDGNEFTCSHLYRDNIFSCSPVKYDKCTYGCNQRLVDFNNEVENRLNK